MTDHWKDQPRVPKGDEEGGQWTDAGKGARQAAGLPVWKGVENAEQAVASPERSEDISEWDRRLIEEYREAYDDTDFMPEELIAHTPSEIDFDEAVSYEGTFYHLSREGFREQDELEFLNDLGVGLYAGRDPEVLRLFYGDQPLERSDAPVYAFEAKNLFVLDVRSPSDKKHFEAEAKRFFPNAEYPLGEFAKAEGYDAIVYFDPWATGEEWLIYNYDKLELKGQVK